PSELRQPGTNAAPGQQQWAATEPERLAVSKLPTSTLGRAPATTPGFATEQRDRRDRATGLPACRADTEPRQLATARAHRFERPAWGTHEYLGRGARSPQSPGPGKRPGDFDPKELFGAARWLTPSRDTGAAQATGATPLVPRVTLQEASHSFCREFFSLDFR